MVTERSMASDLVPGELTLEALQEAAAGCTACDLYERATQTVFGDGDPKAELMLVGEQPGDKEDLEGEPFVGPSGRLLDQGLEAAGIDRRNTYITNVVKHFKWEARGKVRIHKKPNATEQAACRPWLESELQLVRPKVLVALGATAAQSLLGSSFRVTKERGRLVDSRLAPNVLATVHPSSIIRLGGDDRREAFDAFVADLRVAAQALPADSRT